MVSTVARSSPKGQRPSARDTRPAYDAPARSERRLAAIFAQVCFETKSIVVTVECFLRSHVAYKSNMVGHTIVDIVNLFNVPENYKHGIIDWPDFC